MPAPVLRMTKKEVDDCFRFRCKHGHNGLSHYNCYLKERNIQPKIGFIDIESSSLKANFGLILTYCILPEGGKKKDIVSGEISQKDLRNGTMDKNVIAKLAKDMRKFDVLVGHYSSNFDIKFIRTRALMLGIDFPEYNEIQQIDIYYWARRLLALHSRGQNP